MSQLPPLELLKETHSFPTEYTIKVIGHLRNGFVARIVSLVREELQADRDPPFQVRETSGGKYVSITVAPVIQKAEQILGIYEKLSQADDVVMTL